MFVLVSGLAVQESLYWLADAQAPALEQSAAEDAGDAGDDTSKSTPFHTPRLLGAIDIYILMLLCVEYVCRYTPYIPVPIRDTIRPAYSLSKGRWIGSHIHACFHASNSCVNSGRLLCADMARVLYVISCVFCASNTCSNTRFVSSFPIAVMKGYK